ncbi:MAG: acetylornithine/succinylornithine family transaminase [Deltaproteobacteria bacterium]|nr:acetylornithine/succinylornithine family transaminase [Deltaproteobacteria bacterium]
METLFPGVATSDLAGRAAKVLTPNYRPAPIVLVRGEGCRVEDRDGRVYLDMVGGIAVNALGHAHPRLVSAIAQQAAALLHVSNLYLNEPQVALAELLVARSFADRVFFANSGAEANEAALKLARRWQAEIAKAPDKVGVLAFHESFHGRTYGALSATGQPKYHHGFEPLVPGVRFAAYGDLEAVERALATPHGGLSIGVIMLEPIQCEGGIHVPPASFLTGVRELADRHGALVIYDEVQTGVGRTGRWWCYEHGGGAPDIMTTAKGIAGGVPLGVMFASEKAAAGFTAGSHASTFGGNALATRAGLEVMRVIQDEGLIANAAERGAELAAGLAALVDRFPGLCVQARGRGLIQGLELVDATAATRVVEACKARGLLLNAVQGKTLRFVPPLVVDATEIAQALTDVGAVMASLAEA